jgi:D-tyrosyl-tRNA(Tyr) deacylase
MKLVIQRVSEARVEVDGKQVAQIGPGIVTLLGIAQGDNEAMLERLISQVIELRIFEDSAGKMNRSLIDVRGEHLIVSQFTLIADTSQGRRPSFFRAEKPERARELYLRALDWSEKAGVPTQGGVFQADMKVNLINDGPVTLVLQDGADPSSN